MDIPANLMWNSIPQSLSVQLQKAERQHIWLIIGPSGCGKSTIGDYVAKLLNLPFLEGDDVSLAERYPVQFYHIPYYNNRSQFHSTSNIEKMSHDIPLTDEDRWGWLISLCSAAIFILLSPYSPVGVVLTCSALRKCYRDIIRMVHSIYPNLLVHFV
jgi:gluconokinase